MRSISVFFWSVTAAAMVTGCDSGPRPVDWPEARRFGAEVPVYRAPRDPERGHTDFEQPNPTGELALHEALSAALLGNPMLASYAWDVRVREAEALQANLVPNPEVSLEIENFGGNGEKRDFETAETTVVLSQLIELGDKRQLRTRFAELNQDLAAWDYESARIAVLSTTASAFLRTLSMQEQAALLIRNVELAEEAHGSIGKRVDAGAASPLDLKKARIAVSRTRIHLEQTHRELDAARVGLAATWGSTQPGFDRVVGEFGTVTAIPAVEAFSGLVRDNPDVARWATEIVQRQAAIDLERARAVPNLTAGAGVKYHSGPDETAAVVELSMPLPLFDRNQGNLLRSRYALAKAKQMQRAIEVQTGSAITQAYHRLAAAHATATAMQETVLPDAQDAYGGAKTAYEQGKTGYLDVLDAQRTLFEVRGQLIDALADYHSAVVQIESLIARPLSEVGR